MSLCWWIARLLFQGSYVLIDVYLGKLACNQRELASSSNNVNQSVKGGSKSDDAHLAFQLKALKSS